MGMAGTERPTSSPIRGQRRARSRPLTSAPPQEARAVGEADVNETAPPRRCPSAMSHGKGESRDGGPAKVVQRPSAARERPTAQARSLVERVPSWYQ